jgi:hypothetical protein
MVRIWITKKNPFLQKNSGIQDSEVRMWSARPSGRAFLFMAAAVPFEEDDAGGY